MSVKGNEGRKPPREFAIRLPTQFVLAIYPLPLVQIHNQSIRSELKNIAAVNRFACRQ